MPLNEQEVKDLAFEWSIDYKPWDEAMRPQQYAKHGFEQGYKRAQEDQKRLSQSPSSGV